MDYNSLMQKLPKNIQPAYDGMQIYIKNDSVNSFV
jgi:hypothetical protein